MFSGRVGLLGGTFDPLHNGHLALARYVQQALALDQVVLIPAARPPHKGHCSLTPYALRVEMILAALEGHSDLSVSLVEQDTTGPSFSIDTLERLNALLTARLSYFVIGSDAFVELPSWKRFHDIPRYTNLVVVNRHDVESDGLDRSRACIRQYFPEYTAHGECCWQAPGRGDILLMAMPRIDLSSTMVRRQIRCGGDVSAMVPSGVKVLIDAHRLYAEPLTPGVPVCY